MRRRTEREHARHGLRGARQRDDGQMSATAKAVNAQNHLGQIAIRLRPPPRRRSGTSADVERRSASQRLMRAESVVPLDACRRFPPHIAIPLADLAVLRETIAARKRALQTFPGDLPLVETGMSAPKTAKTQGFEGESTPGGLFHSSFSRLWHLKPLVFNVLRRTTDAQPAGNHQEIPEAPERTENGK